MYALVQFEDRTWHIVKARNVYTHDNSFSAKYKNRGIFNVNMVCFNDSDKILESFRENILRGLPSVLLSNPSHIFSEVLGYVSEKEDDSYYRDLTSSSALNSTGFTNDSSYIPNSTIDSTSQDSLIGCDELQEQCIQDFSDDYETIPVDTLCAKSSKSETKKYFCIFCEKTVTKIARHFEKLHSKEDDVKKFIGLPKGSTERRKIIETLRRRGDFVFNTKEAVNDGNMIVTRRPPKNRSGNNYKCCPVCRGFFSVTGLRRHYRKCSYGPVKGDRSVLILSRKIHGVIHPKASDVLKKEVFPILREDEIVRLIRYDELIILYGNKLCIKFKARYHHKMIRAKLRLLGRLLLELQRMNKKIIDMSKLYSPEYYDTFLEAVNVLAGLSTDGKFTKPAVASNIGTMIKVVGKLFITECIKKKDEEAKKFAGQFLELFEEDYGVSINKTVAESQADFKRKKVIELPITKDIKILNNYISKNRDRTFHELSRSYSYEKWKALASFTLISLQLFNRRRAGELERMLLADFENYQSVREDRNCDLYKVLTKEDQKAATEYVRICIRGKLNSIVPVLISKQELKCIELVIRYRQKAGIPVNNKYVFGLPNRGNMQETFLSACDLMREYSEKCGATFPERLRGTLLRKHLATTSALLNFDDGTVSDLAKYLGHAEKIHKEHYRIPLVTRDITRMSRVLEQARGDKMPDISTTGTMDEDSDTSLLEPVRRVHGRTSWGHEEMTVATRIFTKYIEKSTLPSVKCCADVIKREANLGNRTPIQLKAWVNNQIQKKRRSLEQDNTKRLARRRTEEIKKNIARKLSNEYSSSDFDE